MTVRSLAARGAVAVLGVLASCSPVDENAEIATYRKVLDAGNAEVQRANESAPLGVRDSMRLASAHSEALAIQGEEYLQSIIARRRAVSVFLPKVNLTPSYEFRENAGAGRTRIGDVSVEAGVEVNLVADREVIAAAEAIILQREALLLDAQDTLLLDAARTHYEVIRAEQTVSVLENSLHLQNERVEEARARLEAGLIRPLDLSLSEAQSAQTAVALVTARNRVETGRTLLGFLTHASVEHQAVADDLEMPTDFAELDEMVRSACRRRQDITAAAHTVGAARRLVEAAYGAYWPKISFDLEVFLSRQSNPADLDWLLPIRLSIPLFSAGLIEADVRDALSELRQALLVEALIRRIAEAEIRTARQNLAASEDRVRELRVQVAAAHAALEQAEGLYEVGLATNLERLRAQDELLAAQLQAVQADLDRKVYYLDLLRTTGELHEIAGLDRDGSASSPPGDRAKGGSS